MPEPDLSSPKYVAALKVTGIDKADLQPKAQAAFEKSDLPDGVREELAQQRHQVFEKKRQQLLAELEEAVETLKDNDVDAILTTGAVETNTVSLTACKELEREQEKLQKLKNQVRDDITKEINNQLEKKNQAEATAKMREESQAKLKQARAEQAAAAAERKKQQESKDAKTAERMQAFATQQQTEAKELAKKLRESSQRASAKLDERLQSWAEKKEERRRRMADIAARNLEHQRKQNEDKMRQVEEQLIKQQAVQERMESKYDVYMKRAEENQVKYDSKVLEARTKVEEAVTKRQEGFLEEVEKLKKVREDAATLQAESVSALQQQRAKQADKLDKNREREREQFKERQASIRTKLKKDAAAPETKKKLLADAACRRADNQEMMAELAQQNMTRLARSEDCRREQTLAKIKMTKAKLDGIQERKELIMQQRMDTLRESMIEKSHLDMVMTTMRDAPPRQVNKLLKEMGMPLMDVPPTTQGEQNQQDQH